MDLRRAVLIVGLPGSGKTWLARNEYVAQGFTLVDDPKTVSDVLQLLEDDVDVVLTDPNLVFENVREGAEKFFRSRFYQVEFVFFENAPAKAQRNLETREKEERRGQVTVSYFSRNYSIPPDAKTVPVYEPQENP